MNSPTRTCNATRTSATKSTLLRFVKAPDGTAVLDLAHKLPGRGLNLSPTKQAYNLAVKKNLFAREIEATSPPAWEDILQLLQTDALSRLGLAKKAGQTFPGWDSIKEAPRLCGIVLARGAGSDITARVQTLGLEVISPATSEELSAALGVANVGAVGVGAEHAWNALQKWAFARKEEAQNQESIA